VSSPISWRPAAEGSELPLCQAVRKGRQVGTRNARRTGGKRSGAGGASDGDSGDHRLGDQKKDAGQSNSDLAASSAGRARSRLQDQGFAAQGFRIRSDGVARWNEGEFASVAFLQVTWSERTFPCVNKRGSFLECSCMQKAGPQRQHPQHGP
jgi:hypothetical protein